MKKDAWIVSDNVITSLGTSSEANYSAVRSGETGIQQHNLPGLDQPFQASMIMHEPHEQLSRLENIAIKSGRAALRTFEPLSENTILILSTTKGNIELLESVSESSRLSLHASARVIASSLGLQHVQVVSSACISGVLALLVAQRLLQHGKYEHAVVIGVDVLSRFVVSGFKSLHALSSEPCRPFDQDRAGITLGESSACMVLSTTKPSFESVRIIGGGLSNDANHISGPSRTGKELSMAIDHALNTSGITADDIDFISAHGTATLYNDEMEAKAFNYSHIQHKPLHSLKGYFGHTLGAAGVLESIIATRALLENELLPSKGFVKSGVTEPVNIITQLEHKEMWRVLKTASGFGGCNAAIIFEKN